MSDFLKRILGFFEKTSDNVKNSGGRLGSMFATFSDETKNSFTFIKIQKNTLFSQ